MDYKPQVEADTDVRIGALLGAIGHDVNEIAATLVDEDEAAYPGSWAVIGFDRGAAISEYLAEIESYLENKYPRPVYGVDWNY